MTPRHLFISRCICGVLKNKPRILVTHQLQYLKAADEILVLKEVCCFESKHTHTHTRTGARSTLATDLEATGM